MTQTDTRTGWEAWQNQWDAQQEAYLPDREHRFAAMLDTVEASLLTDAPDQRTDRHEPTGENPAARTDLTPRILDLAGGTGSISRRALWRFPNASTVVLDIDAALLAIARGTFADDSRVQVSEGDLGSPEWTRGLGTFDAVLTATALHWLPAERVSGVYAEALSLLRPGGVLINADYMPDPGLSSLTDGLAEVERRVRHQRWADGVPSWEAGGSCCAPTPSWRPRPPPGTPSSPSEGARTTANHSWTRPGTWKRSGLLGTPKPVWSGGVSWTRP